MPSSVVCSSSPLENELENNERDGCGAAVSGVQLRRALCTG
jgi:hypothetical protein